MAAPVKPGPSAVPCGVLVCQSCPYVWEPASTTPEEFAVLVRSGCPECGGWVWLGELVGGVTI